ncbi:MAG TPA: membrane protein insertion efficiency factor YidD [Burkholderiales bacterium]|nr:membrane protein insertion efficiency factor YidD [Burkholderiales bacterium]
MKTALRFLVRLYRYALSPMLAPACRFHPSCSVYAEQALEEHGALRGGWLAARRVCRCGPWHPGGFDPVPGKERWIRSA